MTAKQKAEGTPPPLKPKPFTIVQRKISELKPAEYNPRSLSEKQFSDLKKSFQNLGTLEPAVVNMYPDRENIIISGHQRIKVAAALGMAEYPCLEVSFPPKKEKEANIRMNKNTGEWDLDVLSQLFELDDLKEWGFSPFETGIENQVDYEKEWQGMPEFTQNDKTGARHIIVHFANDEDVVKFSELIGQTVTDKTKMLWYPKAEIGVVWNKRFADES